MPVIPSIALETKVPSLPNTISSFLDLGQRALNYQKSQQTFDADVEAAKAQSSSAQTAAKVAQAVAPSTISMAQSSASSAATAASRAGYQLTHEQTQAAIDAATGILADPAVQSGNDPQGAITALLNAQKRAADQGVPAGPNGVIFGRLLVMAHDNPAMLKQTLTNMIPGGQPATQQSATIQPSGIAVNNGQQSSVVQTNPFAGPTGGAIPGTSQQIQIPPTATTMDGGTPTYRGPQPAAPAGGGAPVQAAPAIGQTEATVGPIASNVAQYQQVQADAAAAPTRIGVLQNIKALAPAAITGDAGALKSFVSKVAGYLGIDSATIAQTNTDVLAKESALLASKGGNTDLARVLNEAATPNGHMTAQAIYDTADQLIGQEEQKLAAQQFFTGTPANSPAYGQKLQQWNANADPRVFEYAAKSPAAQAAMRAELQKTGQWAKFRQKMLNLDSMGVQPPQ